MSLNKKIVLALAATAFLSSCAPSKKIPKISYDDYKGYYKVGDPYQIDGKWYYPKEDPDYDQTGISSWYGDEFHGKKTANGDTFDKYSLTAAHNTLPLPSMVRVTNLENNKTLILMVNDRGPFAKGRVIDVSERAAEILGYKEKGIAKVRVQFLKGQTNRLLAGLQKSPGEKDNGFSLFKKEQEISPYAMDDGEFEEAEESKPFGLAVDKNKILDPVKKLSNILSPKSAVDKDMDELPKISIKANAKSEASSKVKIADIPEPVSEIATAPISDTYGSIDKVDGGDFDTSLDIDTIGKWEGDLNNNDIEKTIEQLEVTTKKDDKKIKAIKTIKEAEQHFIQAGTYSKIDNAYRLEKKLMPLGDVFVMPVVIDDRKLYRVRLGPIGNEKIAKIALQKVVNLGHPDAMIVRDFPSAQ